MITKLDPARYVKARRHVRLVAYLTREEMDILDWAARTAGLSRGEIVGELVRLYIDHDATSTAGGEVD